MGYAARIPIEGKNIRAQYYSVNGKRNAGFNKKWCMHLEMGS